ncbi:hypothetical protein M3Y94_01280300 [Aphelenchoides besseyi]|nr:hypothetical protein M3Y94_01280300 [Aphelenchoides besseyi]
MNRTLTQLFEEPLKLSEYVEKYPQFSKDLDELRSPFYELISKFLSNTTVIDEQTQRIGNELQTLLSRPFVYYFSVLVDRKEDFLYPLMILQTQFSNLFSNDSKFREDTISVIRQLSLNSTSLSQQMANAYESFTQCETDELTFENYEIDRMIFYNLLKPKTEPSRNTKTKYGAEYCPTLMDATYNHFKSMGNLTQVQALIDDLKTKLAKDANYSAYRMCDLAGELYDLLQLNQTATSSCLAKRVLQWSDYCSHLIVQMVKDVLSATGFTLLSTMFLDEMSIVLGTTEHKDFEVVNEQLNRSIDRFFDYLGAGLTFGC